LSSPRVISRPASYRFQNINDVDIPAGYRPGDRRCGTLTRPGTAKNCRLHWDNDPVSAVDHHCAADDLFRGGGCAGARWSDPPDAEMDVGGRSDLPPTGRRRALVDARATDPGEPR